MFCRQKTSRSGMTVRIIDVKPFRPFRFFTHYVKGAVITVTTSIETDE